MMKIKIKHLVNPVNIAVCALIIIVVIVLFVMKGRQENYTNNTVGYSLSYNSGWHISEGLSKKFDDQSFLLGLYIKAGCTMSNFVTDGSSQPNSQDCLKKSKNYKELEPLYVDYVKNWNINNSQYIIFTKLSDSDEKNLPISPFQSVINQQWPKGSFVVIHPFEYKLDFAVEDPQNSSGLSRTFYPIDANIKGYSTDLRGTSIVSKDLVVALPYTADKLVYSGAKIQSVVFSTTAEKGSKDEKFFFNTLNSFKLFNK